MIKKYSKFYIISLWLFCKPLLIAIILLFGEYISHSQTVTLPNQSTVWQAGTIQQFHFTNATGSDIAFDQIKLDIEGGKTTLFSRDTLLRTTGFDYLWDIPLSTYVSSNCHLEIYNNNVKIFSSETFQISAPAPQFAGLTSPIQNNYWFNGNNYYINWNSYSIPVVNIEYSTDNGSYWSTVVSNRSVGNGFNSYNWSLNLITGANPNSLIRISDASNPSRFVQSSNFTLASGAPLAMSQPNASSIWQIGTTHQIQISDNTNSNIYFDQIKLFVDGIFQYDLFYTQWDTLVTSQGFNYNWDISLGSVSSTNYQIKMYNNGNEIFKSAIFELSAPNSQFVSISSPVQKSYWCNGSIHPISWVSYSISPVKIEFSIDNGANWTVIENSLTAVNGINSYNWAQSGISGVNPNSSIRISQVSNPIKQIVSSKFTLAQADPLAVSPPNISTKWKIGTVQNIQVSNNSNSNIYFDQIKFYNNGIFQNLEFSRDSFFTPGVFNYNWNIDNAHLPTTNGQLKFFYKGDEIASSEIFELYLSYSIGGNVNLAIPANIFSSIPVENRNFTVTLANGDPLPAWLSFNEETLTFSGTAPNQNTVLDIIVSASDGNKKSTISYEFTLVIGTLTSIRNIDKGDCKFFPNPTRDIINFDFVKDKIQKITIADLTGKIFNIEPQNQMTRNLDISDFGPGIYFITIYTDKDVFSEKILKE
jgi:hypothetical protein